MIGSYSMPAWLERAKNDFLQRRVSRHDLDDMYDAVRKAAIKDQEVAGVDIVSDGELHRDNMIDYFAERIPGVQVDHGSKRLYYDFYESVVRSKLATGSLGLLEEVRFLRKFSQQPSKISISGPHALVKRHPQSSSIRRRRRSRSTSARVMNFEVRELVRAGATASADRRAVLLGLPGGSAVGDQGGQRAGRRRRAPTSRCTSATATATASRRSRAPTGICFRRVLDANVHALSLEFARRGEDDLQLFKEFKVPFTLAWA